MAVEAWVCPVCKKLVGVRNVGTAQPVCAACAAKLHAAITALVYTGRGRPWLLTDRVRRCG